MNYYEVAAPAPLDNWVRCFWFLTTEAGGPQLIIPDGRIEIVLHRATPFGQVGTCGTVLRQSPEVVAGQLTRPIVVRPTGPADVIGIRFRTAGARDLLRLPLGELMDQVVPLSELAPGLVTALQGVVNDSDPVRSITAVLLNHMSATGRSPSAEPRSAERRVGKECRSRGSPDH